MKTDKCFWATLDKHKDVYVKDETIYCWSEKPVKRGSCWYGDTSEVITICKDVFKKVFPSEILPGQCKQFRIVEDNGCESRPNCGRMIKKKGEKNEPKRVRKESSKKRKREKAG